MSLPFNIAIDGYSSCGKSSIAKKIAQKYHMRYIDSGAMYRAITLFFMKKGVIKNKNINYELLDKLITNIHVDFVFDMENKRSKTFLNNENVEDDIRSIDVSENVSLVARISKVRKKLIAMQKKIGLSKNIVMDGRDIGTKVLPKAKIKLFVTAQVEIRAQRRLLQLKNAGSEVSYEKILNNLNDRDRYDINRKESPLVKAHDAILLDNTNMNIKEQDVFIDNLIRKFL
ncbi:MAG: cytidylate kinase [Flavobacteriales bacterium]|nr:cytidylate kinase [Flavobacteriales bacterium]|tara:strand:- start:16712 stop:17398 length:687 start_codon:yes stop_codon:yes gene_type:complete